MRSQPQSAETIESVLRSFFATEFDGLLIDNHNNRAILSKEICDNFSGFFCTSTLKDAVESNRKYLEWKKPRGRTIVPYPKIPTAAELSEILAQVLAEHPWVADSDRNGEMIVDWIVQNAGNRLTLENYRAAIQVLKNQLDRRPPAAPAPAPVPETPSEDLGTLPSGEKQLSLRTPEWALHKASPAQLKNFLKRARTQS